MTPEHKQRFSKSQTALYSYAYGVVKKLVVLQKLQGQTAVYLSSRLTWKLPTQIYGDE